MSEKDSIDKKQEEAFALMTADTQRLQDFLKGDHYFMAKIGDLNNVEFDCKLAIEDRVRSFRSTVSQTGRQLDRKDISQHKHDRVIKNLEEAFAEQVDLVIGKWKQYIATIENPT